MQDSFTAKENPINLATGEVAHESVIVHQAFQIGEKLIRRMSNQLVFILSFKCKDMVVPMNTTASLSIEGKTIYVGSTLSFQKLIAVYSLEELSRPMSLFDKDNLMDEADKLTVETLQQYAKYDTGQQKQRDQHYVVLVFLLLTLNIFQTLC